MTFAASVAAAQPPAGAAGGRGRGPAIVSPEVGADRTMPGELGRFGRRHWCADQIGLLGRLLDVLGSGFEGVGVDEH